MALPTTIVAKSHWIGHIPPFKSSANEFYALAKRSVTDDSIRIYKATDPSDSWTEQTTSPIVTVATVVSAVQLDDVIHIASYDSGTYEYHQFNMATDAYDVKDELIETPTDAPDQPWISIAVKSTGDAVVVYAGDTDLDGADVKERADVNIRTSGTWGGPASLAVLASSHYGNPVCVKGSDSDRVHIAYQSSTAGAGPPSSWLGNAGRTLFIGGTLSPADESTPDTSGALLGLQNGVSWDDGGTETIRFCASRIPTGKIWSASEVASILDWDALIVTEFADTSHSPHVTSESGVSTLARDPSDNLHALWSNTDDGQDIWYSTSIDTGDTWSTEAEELDAITCNFISAAVYQRGFELVLAYIYDDAGSTKYNEKVLETIGPLLFTNRSIANYGGTRQ